LAAHARRPDVIADLIGKVGDYPFVAVVGRSGSGKLSVVEAGLLPALRRQYKATVWDAVSFKPGAWPLQSLATCFNAGVPAGGVFATDTAIENEVAALRRGDADQLARVIAQRLAAMPEQPDRLLIHVDQWEELYSRAPPADQPDARARHEADVARFIDLLLAASEGAAAQRAAFGGGQLGPRAGADPEGRGAGGISPPTWSRSANASDAVGELFVALHAVRADSPDIRWVPAAT
jgi:hypothetical protein